MRPLDYQTRPHAVPRRWGVLIALPALLVVVTFGATKYNTEHEPFGAFHAEHAAVHVVTPILAMALAGCWLVRAKRERLPLDVFVSIAAWIGLAVVWCLLLGISYFREPWVWNTRPVQ
jgi:hypothetical protein